MKKKISLLMALTLITSMFSAMSASAAISGRNGYYTPVDSVINNYPIQSFQIDNHTVVTTTDLKDYGFSVIWDGAARAVYITRSLAHGTNFVGSVPVRNFQPYKDEVAFTTENSDIRAFIQGTEVPCYVSHNRTYVRFTDLTLASVPGVTNVGHVWNAQTLRSEININDLVLGTNILNGTPAYNAFVTAQNAPLSYDKAIEILKEGIANSVYNGYAFIEDDYTRALFEARINPGYAIPAPTDYTFRVFFDFDAPATAATLPGVLNPGPDFSTEFSFPVTVNQDGTINWTAIPQWVTFFCTNN